jgi:hypothetical protein
MPTVMKGRTCQDCSTPLGRLHLEPQCYACRARTEWRPLRGWPEPVVVEVPIPAPAAVTPPKPRTCEQDGHQACEHFHALVASVLEAVDDAGICFVCGADEDEGVVEGKHRAGCALAVVLAPAERQEGEGEKR